MHAEMLAEGRTAESVSSIDFQVSSVTTAADARGKHRIVAELKRLEQEASFLEEELEKTEKVSTACQELLFKIENKPDPLLPITNGPANPSWDQWFEGPRETRGCRCWIL